MIHLTMSIVLLTYQRPAAMGPWVPILIAMVISFSCEYQSINTLASDHKKKIIEWTIYNL